MTGIEYALVTIETNGTNKLVKINTSKSLSSQTERIAALFQGTHEIEKKNFNVQCKLTPRSTVPLWINADIDRCADDKIIKPSSKALSTNDHGSNYSLSEICSSTFSQSTDIQKVNSAPSENVILLKKNTSTDKADKKKKGRKGTKKSNKENKI